ncbi:mCG144826, partial [Mus musculus]
ARSFLGLHPQEKEKQFLLHCSEAPSPRKKNHPSLRGARLPKLQLETGADEQSTSEQLVLAIRQAISSAVCRMGGEGKSAAPEVTGNVSWPPALVTLR